MNLEEIKAYQGHPALLDRLAIATPRNQLMAMFGLGAELYVAPRDRKQLRHDMFTVQDHYYQQFKDRLSHTWRCTEKNPDGENVKLGAANPIPAILDMAGDWPRDRSYENIMYMRYTHPDFPGDANTVTPWVGQFLIDAEIKNRLSYYKCYLPVLDANKGVLHFETLRDSLLHWCGILKPQHGGAGYCVILELGAISGERYVYSTLQRHPGLNFPQTINFTANAAGVFNRIKSINWLTVLNDSILEELGGMAAAKAALEPECTFHPYAGGVVIQAGELPQLGDTYTHSIPEAYRKVARFTKPVRFEDYRSSLFKVFEPLDSKEESLKWVRRFD